MRTLSLALLALTATPALAVDVGVSHGLGGTIASFGGGDFGIPAAGGLGFESLPSLDLRADPVIVQIHALDFIEALAAEEVELSANVLFQAVESEIGTDTHAVVQPGGSLDLRTGAFTLGLGATSRFGVEVARDAGVGAYVTPTAGFVLIDGELGLLTGGRVEFSAWF